MVGILTVLGKEDPPTLQEQQCMHQVHMELMDHINHILDQAYIVRWHREHIKLPWARND